MSHPRLFMFLTVMSLIGAAGVVVTKYASYDELYRFVTTGEYPPSLLKRAEPKPVVTQRSVEEILTVQTAQTQDDLDRLISDIPKISSIPWLRSEILHLFQTAGGRQCQMLPPEVPVSPSLLSSVNSDEAEVTSLRETAFVVGLTMDPAARKSLPSLTKSSIESYLNQHLLAVQPIIYHNARGEALFGGKIQSAFFMKARPEVTRTPEPMINEAMQGFRVLGVLSDEQSRTEPTDFRTLVLAFAYMRAAGAASKPVQDYELLFLHLLPKHEGGGSQPQMAVFATTDGREMFQELELSTETSAQPVPSVMASIRFDDFTMLGLYPAKPVVTGVRNRVRQSYPVRMIRSRIQTNSDHPAQSFQKLLDELHGETALQTVALP